MILNNFNNKVVLQEENEMNTVIYKFNGFMKKRCRVLNFKIILTLIFFILTVSGSHAATLFVDNNASGTNKGTSWDDAYTDLQIAIDAANSGGGGEVWVAAGTYTPTSWPNGGDHDQEMHFSLKIGVAVYGGFVGTETLLEERNVEANKTILSGDIGREGDDYDNCNHVFYHSNGINLDDTAVLNGFTITGGNTYGSGGGMYNYSSSPTITNCKFSNNLAELDGGGVFNYKSSPTFTNCTFSNNTACTSNQSNEGNEGGGMYNYSSFPTLNNCTFSGNYAYDDGGGIFNYSSSPTLTNCTFSDNSVHFNGGGVYNRLSSPTLTNCIFSGNSADYGGGGISNSSSSPTLSNCTFSGNNANYEGGGIFNKDSSSPVFTNCVLWGNTGNLGKEVLNYDNESKATFSFCNIQDCYDDTGQWVTNLGTDNDNNIDSDPLFVRNPGTSGQDDPGDLHLKAGSPCINTGNNEGLPADMLDIDGDENYSENIPYDFESEERIFNGTVDMGADEYVNNAPVLSAIGNKSINENQTLEFTVSAVDPNGENLTFDVSDLPDGANFDSNTKTFTWTPNYDDTGNYNVTFSVTDNGTPSESDSETITISVDDVNRPPVLAEIGDKSIDENNTLNFTVSGLDPDNDTLTYTASDLPDGAEFNANTKTFTWTPGYDVSGNYEVTLSVTDDGTPSESDSETITISVGDVNRPPVLDKIGDKKIAAGDTHLITMTASDSDGDDLMFSVSDLPDGAVFDQATRTLTWTPSPEIIGDYEISVLVTDDGEPRLTDSETFLISVTEKAVSPKSSDNSETLCFIGSVSEKPDVNTGGLLFILILTAGFIVVRKRKLFRY